jgi:formate/nitrite transporter FocA (FNT family)
LLLLCGWLVPAHLRAVDAAVLQRAGETRSTLAQTGIALERANNPEAAQLLLQAAQQEKIPWTGDLASALATHTNTEKLYTGGPVASASMPVTSWVIKLDNREPLLAWLETNGSPAVQELLRARDLSNTVIFPASTSSAGQAFDAAVSVAGLLLAGNHLAPGLRDAVLERATFARTRADAQPLEEILMDLMSLGQRLTWGQLIALTDRINDPSTLDQLANQTRNAGAQLPALFAAVVVSSEPDRVAKYMSEFSQTGLNDLAASLRDGEGGLDELLQRQQRLYASPLRARWTASGPLGMFHRATTDYALRAPTFALMLKWFFYISGGFLLALAGHLGWTTLEVEEPLRAGGFHLAREVLFALGFLLVVLLLSEPFLAQESQKAQFAFRLRLPVAGAAAASTSPPTKPKLMDTQNLLTLLLFFVLQGLIYCACLVKLAEIRREKVPARVQLKLLENEEHLFDAGLYLGFAGTIICLILVSLAKFQFTLMAAYSSTSFGIIFVSAFKIFNLRPARRRLLMENEAQTAASERTLSAAPTLVTTS